MGQHNRVGEPAHQLCPGPRSPMTFVRPSCQFTDCHESHAHLVPDEGRDQRRRKPALVAEGRDIGVDHQPGHDLRHVLVPEGLQVGQELVEFFIRLEDIGAQLVG